ncbi:MAG: putative rane protein [Micavibrio sp.]|nr:putative rane protein [Micavibrio sp.]
MEKILIHWALSALAIWLVSQIVPGFVVDGAGAALIAAVVIGLVNATIGMVLKIITLPLTIMTLGIFWFIINALMIELAANFIPGFYIASFASAFWGGIVLTLVNIVLKALVKSD